MKFYDEFDEKMQRLNHTSSKIRAMDKRPFKLFQPFNHWLKSTIKSKKITQQSVDYLYTPIIAIMLFMLAMFAILWSLTKQESEQSELVFFREVTYAEQRIQINLDENEEQVLKLSKLLPYILNQEIKNDFYLKASQIINRHSEVLEIQAINTDLKKSLTYPMVTEGNWLTDPTTAKILNQSFQRTLRDALVSGHGQYSNFINLELKDNNTAFNRERSLVFWYVQPASKFSEQTHNIAILYSAPLMISRVIPKDILGRHRFSIIDNNGQVLYSLSDRNLKKNHSTHQIKLSKFPENLILQGESYPLPSNLTYQMLFWIVIGLCSYVIWSFWSLWRQMKFRQNIQRNLIKETNFRRAIEDSMPVGLRVHELDGRITYVNPAFCRMVGWTAEELQGQKPPFAFWTDEEEITSNLLKLSAVFRGEAGPISGIEATITAKDGKKIAVRNFVSPMVDANNKQTGWIASLVDISEPRKIREELAVSQQRFITVLEGLTAGISVVNPKTGELLFSNNLYQDMFGASSKAHLLLLGNESFSSDNLALDIDNVDGFAGLPSSALTPIIGDSQEVQLPDNPKWYEVRRRYIPWTDGHLAQLLITTDITERRLAQDHLRIQEERMQFSSRLTTMGEMASSIAHELNQPLAAINNYCMGVMNRLRAKNDNQINEEIIPALEKVSTQALRAGTIIQRIRNFVKRSAPQRESCDIHKIISQSIELAEIEANRQGLDIQKQVMTNLPECFVDPILIEQVIINLLKNAIDSMRLTYSRSIRGKLPPIHIIGDLEETLQPPMLRIRIIDNGGGIQQDSIEKIYEPFFSTKDEGMGMGLNICRSIIESHEGRLWGENNPITTKIPDQQNMDGIEIHSGCTFTILLPIESYLVLNTKGLTSSVNAG
jgi:PAS domain S-box-containing protein